MDTNFINSLKDIANYKYTENGAVALSSTKQKVYDLFAFGGAYRNRTDADCVLLFKEAFEEDYVLATRCLFYLRDILKGQGERRFFRVCYKWLCNNYIEVAQRNLKYVVDYGRWDDVLYITRGTELYAEALRLFGNQLVEDTHTQFPSLAAKWAPSINTHSKETRAMANELRNNMGLTPKGYRKLLSTLRKRLNVLERLLSAKEWDKIEFDKLPSVAGLKYKNMFLTKEELANRYKEFISSKNTKVNAKALYPYHIVRQALNCEDADLDSPDRAAIEKYWTNLKDFTNGAAARIMCVCDTSGSMTCGVGVRPIDVAISLSMYCAERLQGDFHNCYISFASRPQIIEIKGVDFVDKVNRIYDTALVDSTNLIATFDLIKSVALKSKENAESLPDSLLIISDMEIDEATSSWCEPDYPRFDNDNIKTEMQKVREEWAAAGLKMPKLIYWNVDARQNTILDSDENVTFVSGCSPSILEAILSGKTGWDLCLAKINGKRYSKIR